MTVTSAALIGLAELLDSHDLGVWSESAAYSASDVGIVVGRLPLKPVKVIGLTPYRVTAAEPDALGGISAVQIRFRSSDLRALIDMESAVFELLDHRGPTRLGGVFFAQIWCQISTPPGALGSDDLPELADTYYLRTDR